MTKYVIQWKHHRVEQVFFVSIEYKGHDWDTYGTTPSAKIRRTALLRDAKLFDSKEEIDKIVAKLISLDEDVRSMSGLVSGPHIIEVTDKQLFKAKLAEEALYK